MNELLQSLVEEQRKTNQLLLILIEYLAGDDEDGEPSIPTYLNGRPLNADNDRNG